MGKHSASRPEFTPSSLSFSGECDRCGVRAKVRVIMMNERILDFCMHHYRKYADALAGQNAVVIAETE